MNTRVKSSIKRYILLSITVLHFWTFSFRFAIETIRYRSFIIKELVLSLTSLLGAVSHCAEYDYAQSQTILDFWTFLFLDSAQCDTARSLTLRSITLRGVTFLANIFAINKFFSETILDCLSGTQMGSIHDKKLQKISWHCLFKSSKWTVWIRV